MINYELLALNIEIYASSLLFAAIMDGRNISNSSSVSSKMLLNRIFINIICSQ